MGVSSFEGTDTPVNPEVVWARAAEIAAEHGKEAAQEIWDTRGASIIKQAKTQSLTAEEFEGVMLNLDKQATTEVIGDAYFAALRESTTFEGAGEHIADLQALPGEPSYYQEAATKVYGNYETAFNETLKVLVVAGIKGTGTVPTPPVYDIAGDPALSESMTTFANGLMDAVEAHFESDGTSHNDAWNETIGLVHGIALATRYPTEAAGYLAATLAHKGTEAEARKGQEFLNQGVDDLAKAIVDYTVANGLTTYKAFLDAGLTSKKEK